MTLRHDSYARIARHYDRQKMDWYAANYGGRLRSLLADRGVGGSRLLDAGCGTGTLALAMAGSGYSVTGVDLSEALLDVARKKDAAGAVRWIQADITRLDLRETFDVITSVTDVLNHLETLDEWEKAFRCFAAHLRPEGLLFLDVLTCRGLERQDGYMAQDHDAGILILGTIWEPWCRRSTMKITSLIPAGSPDLYERATETISEWGQPVDAISERLRRAGFDEPERVWALTGEPETEERLSILARRGRFVSEPGVLPSP